MLSPYQYPLDLHFEPALGDEDFFVSVSNQDVVGHLKAPHMWATGALLITGPQSSGKTHLTHVWQRLMNAVLLPTDMGHAVEAGGAVELIQGATAVAVDDIDQIASENTLQHLINAAREMHIPLLLTSRYGPLELPFQLPDLMSRLKGMMGAAILPPDDQLLHMLLVKQLADQQLIVSQEVVTFLVPRMERSYEAIAIMVDKLRLLSLSTKRKVTIPLAKEALEA